MLLTNDQLKGIIESLNEQKYDITMRDISFVALCRFYSDGKVAYKIVFGNDSNPVPYDMYKDSEKVVAIENYLNENFPDSRVEAKATDNSDSGGITFDELKKGLIDDMNSLITLRDSVDEDGRSVLDPKEMASVVKNISDIRLRLTQHFGATQKEDSQRIIVVKKYDHVCPYCRREY